MTAAEQAAFETVLNAWLQHAIVIFAIGYWLYWGWRKLGLPGIDWRHYLRTTPREVSHNRSTYEETAPDEAPLQVAQPPLQTPAKPIATLQTACKPDFAIASEVQRLAELL